MSKLAEICRKYPIQMDMGYTTEVISRKKACWIKIHEEFNAANPGKSPRDVNQLKGLWKRLKLKTKADMDGMKKDAKKTGGGPPKPPLEKDAEILAEMFQGQFDPLMDTVDDDAVEFQEGPGEELNIKEQAMNECNETSEVPSRRKRGESVLERRLLEMAEEEHKIKMDTLKLQNKKAKLELLLIQKQCQLQKIDYE